MLKTLIMKAALVAFLGSISFVAFAIADTQRFEVPAGDLAAALESLAKQANVDLVYQDAQVKGLRTAGVSGNLSPRDAVVKLLEGTPLEIRTDEDSGAILITTPTPSGGPSPQASEASDNPSPGTGEGRGEGKPKWWQRLAQATPAAGTGEGRDPRSGKDESSKEDTSTSTAGQELPAPEETGKAIPEILVRGSRKLNADIKRTQDDIQPYVVFDHKKIASSGANNVEEFLRKHLTSADSPARSVQAPGNGNISFVDLRGLGPGQTLVLVDGRRVGSFNLGGAAQQPDLNGIPIAAIDRIEILPTTASGIYGGSATGGVINIVLMRDFSGLDLAATYGNSFHGDYGNRRFDLTTGLGFSDTNIMIVASHSQSDPLQVRDRNFFIRGRNHILANNPNSILQNFLPPLGAHTNIMSADGTNLVLRNGSIDLGSTFTSVPSGYAGPDSDNGAGLVSGAGQYDLELAGTAQGFGGGNEDLVAATETNALSISAQREFNSRLRAFVELSGSRNVGTSRASPVGGSFFLLGTDPANPFLQDVLVTTPTFGADTYYKTKLDDLRAVGGLIVEFGADWRAALDVTWDRTQLSQTSPQPFLDSAADTAVSDGTLHVFRDASGLDDYSPYLLPPSRALPTNSTLKNAALRASGPIHMDFFGGQPVLSLLAEHRDESFDDIVTDNGTSQRTIYARSQTVDSVYMEANVPAISEHNHVPWLRTLDFQVALRRDSYDIVGAGISPEPRTELKSHLTSTDPTIGFRVKPVDDIMFRASYGTGFLPPALNQLVGQIAFLSPRTASRFVDPMRGNEQLGLHNQVLFDGNNADLRPEESSSYSAGFVITPHLVPNLRVSLDWTRISKSDNITLFNLSQTNINLESVVPGLIDRGAPLNDGFAVGPIVTYHGGFINAARQDVEALDLSADYKVDTERLGTFSFGLSANHLLHSSTQTVPAQPRIEFAGQLSNLEWKANSLVKWDIGNWTSIWTSTYFDSYWFFPDHSIAPDQGAAKIRSQMYHDLSIRYRFGDNAWSGALSQTEIQLNIQNLFGKKPPIDTVNSPLFLYSTLGDPGLTRYSLSIRKHF